MAFNVAKAYQNTTVTTASPAELTLMLYEGAIKFCNIAIIGLEKKDYAKVNENLVKAQNIIAELGATLDFNYPVSEEFKKIYDYIYQCLVEGNIKKDLSAIEEGLQYIREMRDTWKELMAASKQSVR